MDPRSGATQTAWTFSVVLRLEAGGPEVGREPVTEADLSEIRSEAWFSTCLRRGLHRCSPGEVSMRLLPSFAGGSRALSRFAVEMTGPDRIPRECRFTSRSLRHVARRARARLRTDGLVGPRQACVYEIEAEEAGPQQRSEGGASGGFAMTLRVPPPDLLNLPLAGLRKRARAVGDPDELQYPVFYTEEAFAHAERCSRRGAERNPPVETGGVLTGPLCACPETGEVFAVVSEVLELAAARETRLTLSYTSRSWALIQDAVGAKRTSLPAHRILGQCHGHNFIPRVDESLCGDCDRREACTCTSTFVSEEDLEWMGAVFGHQPWQLCHIFGLSVRGDRSHGLYGRRDGELEPRGFYLIPAFDPQARGSLPAPRDGDTVDDRAGRDARRTGGRDDGDRSPQEGA